MTRLLFILLLPITAIAQQNESFTVTDHKLIWQADYGSSLSSSQLYSAMLQSGIFERIDTAGNVMSGRTTNIAVNYLAAGRKRTQLPGYLVDNNIKGFALVKKTDTGYSVKMRDISIIESKTINAGILSTKAGDADAVEIWALKPNSERLKPSFEKAASLILSITLYKRFTVR